MPKLCQLHDDEIDARSVHLGGFVGYSAVYVSQLALGFDVDECSPSGNVKVILNSPPSHRVFSLPGMPHSHCLRSRAPEPFRMGFA